MKTCYRCSLTKPLSDFSPAKTCKDGHRNYCKVCQKIKKDEWRKTNLEHHNAKNRAWVALHPEKDKALKKKSLLKALENNPACMRESRKRARLKNPMKYRAIISARRKRVKLATPLWVDKFLIEEAYILAQLRTQMTGFEWHVDHIIPLRGKLVCGLNVIENLQVIPAEENLRKRDKYVIE
jgi:hypothetical protein